MRIVWALYLSLTAVTVFASSCVGVQWAAAATLQQETPNTISNDSSSSTRTLSAGETQKAKSKAMILDPFATTQIVGNLPYSNQWIYDRPGNYLYFNADRMYLQDQSITAGNYTVDYGARDLQIFSLDYFIRFGYLAKPGGESLFRNFAVWGRYRLGYGGRSGQLYDPGVGETLQAEKTSLNVVFGEAALLLGFESLSWFKPYFGFNYSPYWFRNSSSTPGAELQGQAATYGPMLGAHFPIFFDNRASLFAEVHGVMAPAGSDQLFESGTSVDFGAGFAF